MMNEVLQRENIRLRDRLQACESRQRQAARESLVHILMAMPIIDAAPVLARLDQIITLLNWEGGAQ